MKEFPKTFDYLGLNQPVGEEKSISNLTVEGKIPEEIKGAFFRAVPDPAHPPKAGFEDDTSLSADGMISRLLFNDNGTVDFDIKYIETARWLAEKEAGKALFGLYRNPYTDDDSVKGVDRTVANTTPVWHAGRLLMTKEDGRAYRVDPNTLETLGSYDFDGVLKSETMTAHVRVDPDTQELFFFGYEADGLASTKVAYCICDSEGNLTSEQWFDTPYCSMLHDFAVTENYAIFPVFPTTADLDRIKAGGSHWIHEPELESWLGYMPKYGDVKDMKWIKGPKGVSVYHIMNGFETPDGCIHVDQHLTETNMFTFIQKASGINKDPRDMKGGLVRWSIDPNAENPEITSRTLGPMGDLSRIQKKDNGRPYDRAWYATMNPDMKGPPTVGAVVNGLMLNALLDVNHKTGEIKGLMLPPKFSLSEPVHIESKNGLGWLMLIVDEQTGDNDFIHQAWILDANDINAEPLAKVTIPHRLRTQIHGTWVDSAELASK